MVTPAAQLLQHIRRLVTRSAAATADAVLLERFVRERDEDAFAALLARHGPMVLRVCGRILGDAQVAEDAFQATFLVLARRAGDIGRPQRLAAYLHGIALRVARKARAAGGRRLREAGPLPADVADPRAGPPAEACARELLAVLDEEVRRLPEAYRLPVLLCCLQGRTQEEAARQLGWTPGSLQGRLERGRKALHARLARRGVVLPAGALAALAEGAAGASVPGPLALATVHAAKAFATGGAAAGAVPARVAALTEGVLKAMFLSKAKILMVGVVLAGLTGFVVRAGLSRGPVAPPQDQLPAAAKAEADGAPEPSKKEPNPDRPASDRAAMVGTWQSSETVTRTVNGKVLPPEVRKVRWVITGDKIIRTDGDGFIDEEWTFRLDPAKNPRAIDLTSRYGTLSGLYRLEGGRLTLSLGLVGKRPTEFPDKTDGLWALRRLNREPGRAVRRYANAPGCYWMVDPTTPGGMMATAGIVWIYEKGPEGAARITLAGTTPGPNRPEYRPVLLDAGKERYLPESLEGGLSGLSGGPIVALSRWRMDPKVLPAEKVALIGIEALTPESHRAAGREAAERARKAGVEVLPWPEVGQAYAFRLTTIDGRVLRSEDFKGKVVVIDWWATWCSPCMALVPELKRLHERWHKDGLEIIGVGLDQGAETVRKASREHGMTWPQVLVPAGGKARQLWQDAAGIESVPRVLVIDRAGVLRFDSPDKLEEVVARLLGISRQQPPVKSKP